MIIPPNIQGLKFNVSIEAPEYPNYSAKLRSTLLRQAILTFKGKLDLKGNIQYILESRKGTKFQYKEELKDLACGPVEFIMFFFYRSEKESSDYGLEMTSDELERLQRTLDEYGGVKLYRNNVRVTGFGDPGNDWLQLDALRVNSPSTVPSNNQIIGFVRITAEQNPNIVDTVAREGIIESTSFEDLRKFVRAAVKYFSNRRAELEGKKKKARKATRRTEMKKIVKAISAPQEPQRFIEFRSRYPMVFYKPLEKEINSAVASALPNATLMLTRKLVENLLLNIWSKSFRPRWLSGTTLRMGVLEILEISKQISR